MNRTNKSTEQTKAHILEVAREQFFKKGYAATSINEIIDRADVTKPTVYYHFKNKAGLFAALVEQAYHDAYEHRRAQVDHEASAVEQIRQVVQADFAFCLAQPELVQFVLSLSFPLPDEQAIDLREIHQRDYEFFRDIIERGVNSDELRCADTVSAALMLQGAIAINIMSFLKMKHDADFLSPERAREVADVLLAGIIEPVR